MLGRGLAHDSSRARARARLPLLPQDPPDFIKAHPLETDVLDWRFTIQGPPGSPYEGGIYMGKLKFPDQYPFKPPSIFMLTPNGRFETDRRLCLSMSDYHPESWCPAWKVATIIQGVLSFMLEDEQTTGAIVTSDAKKRELARASHEYNRAHKDFQLLFRELAEGGGAPPASAPAAAPQPAGDGADVTT